LVGVLKAALLMMWAPMVWSGRISFAFMHRNLLVTEGEPLEAGFSAYGRAWPETPNPPAITFAFVAGLADP
jgi:hypothetical protein